MARDHLLREGVSMPSLAHIRAARNRFIPFINAALKNSTQNPVIRLHGISKAAATTNATANSQVVTIQFADVINATDWAGLFDEVRVVRGTVQFAPNLSGGGITNGPTAISVGVIDFDDATALANWDFANSYDTAKKYFLAPGASKIYSWEIDFDWMPDQAWFDTAATVPLAYFKNYTTVNHGLGTQSFVGYWTWSIDCQFRQQRGA